MNKTQEKKRRYQRRKGERKCYCCGQYLENQMGHDVIICVFAVCT